MNRPSLSPQTRRTIGRILIWAGILAWAPFFYFVGNNQPVSIFPFLAMHLVGVLSGAWLRASADHMEGLNKLKAQHGWRLRLSRIMIYLGVLAWAPYFYLEQVAGQDVEIGPFLAMHLIGVLGGAALRVSLEVEGFVSRK
jgi:hypothetical protein